MNVPDTYAQFFFKTEEGRHFLTTLETLIESNHQKAENDPDHARDFVQRAKGVREIISHIQSATTKPKKGKSM